MASSRSLSRCTVAFHRVQAPWLPWDIAFTRKRSCSSLEPLWCSPDPITSQCCGLELARSTSACTLYLRPVQSPSAPVQGVPSPGLYPGLMGFLGSSSMGPKSSGASPTTFICSYLLSCPSCRPLPWEFRRPLAATSHVGMVHAGNTTPCASLAGSFALSMPGPL